MSKHRAISSEEKRAELEAAGEDWPTDEGGLPKVWYKDGASPAGGYWRSRLAKRAREWNRYDPHAQRAYYRAHREERAAYARRWREANLGYMKAWWRASREAQD